MSGELLELDDEARLRSRSAELCTEAFAPLPTTSVSEWADANAMLSSETAAEAGRFRTDRVPYLRGIMDALGDETIREVVFAKASQLAGTTGGLNYLGYLIDQAPCGVLYVWPTEKALRAWSTKRLAPMIRDTACLARKFPKSRRRESGDSIASKDFAGGYILALTAKSTADLRSHSARVAICEEVDEWEGDVGEQGDPVELVRVRIRTFWNGKLYLVSTPTIKGFSRIWSELETSTWNEYHVPCPECGHLQTLRWQDEEEGETKGRYRLLFDRDDTGELIPGSCRYECEACEARIDERHKQQMLAEGVWIPRYPERQKVGFHINSLYSPLFPWDEIARAFLRAKTRPTLLKTFVNTVVGLPFEESGEAIDAHYLARRVEPYAAAAPRGVAILTAGVDVQADRLELVIVGHGADNEKWVIAWKQLEGDPGQDEVWAELDEELLTPLAHEDGVRLRIAAVCVDAGYQTERVHRFCEPRSRRRIIAIVGRSGRGKPLLTAPGPDKFKRSKAKKRPTHVVGVDSGKDLLLSQLRVVEPGPGYVHFPDSLDPVFFDQLTSEKLLTKYRGGRPSREWELLPGRRNEALDMTVYAEAALVALGPKVRARLGAFAERLRKQGERRRAAAAVAATAPSSTAPAPQPAPLSRRRPPTPPRTPWINRF